MSMIAGAGAAVLGGLVGAAELLGRYRVDPIAAVRSLPGAFYCGLNAAAAGAAYVIAVVFGWRFGVPSAASPVVLEVTRVLIASFGAMALLRSSLFVFSQGDSTVDAGPAAVLASLRAAADRAIDQRQAQGLLETDVLAELSFADHGISLVELCSAALMYPDVESAKRLGELVARLTVLEDMDDAAKLHVLAMALVELVGRRPVEAAANRIRSNRSQRVDVQATTSSDRDEDNTDDDEERWVLQARLHASMVKRLLERPDADDASYGQPMLGDLSLSDVSYDLRLLQAFLLDISGQPEEAAQAYDTVNPPNGSYNIPGLQAAGMLFGAGTVLSRDAKQVRRNLVGVLRLSPGQGLPETFRLAAWVYADALYELWPFIDDSALAVEVLTASIQYRDLWDVRAARAACHLRVGDRSAAISDFDVALQGEEEWVDLSPPAKPESGRGLRNPAPPQIGPTRRELVIGDWGRPVLEPLRGLLEPELLEAIRDGLCGALLREWDYLMNEFEGPRSWAVPPIQPQAPVRPSWPRDDSLALMEKLPALATAFAAAIPRRQPRGPLQHADFLGSEEITPPSTELLDRLATAFRLTDPTVSNSH
jgi:hypothetical protein